MSQPAPGTQADRMRWLAFLGTPDCTCPDAYRSLGRLYGVPMGSGWVRLSTAPDCPHHPGPTELRP